MKPISTSESKPMRFTPSEGSHRFRANSDKIGWFHSVSETPGVKFDITIKDAIGRVKLERKGCGNDTARHGELIRLPTMLGEELEVEVTNIQGAESVDVFLN